jgi:predicted DNA-binding protein with PD1-like motif
MRAKIIHESAAGSTQGERTFAIIFDKDDEVMADLTGFIRDHNISAGRFTAIGAFRELTLGFFDWGKKAYQKIPIREQVEVLSLVGDIALKDKQPTLHAHVVVGKAGRHRPRWPSSGGACAADAGGDAGRVTEFPAAHARRGKRTSTDRHRGLRLGSVSGHITMGA